MRRLTDPQIIKRLERGLEALEAVKARARVARKQDLLDTADTADFTTRRTLAQVKSGVLGEEGK